MGIRFPLNFHHIASLPVMWMIMYFFALGSSGKGRYFVFEVILAKWLKTIQQLIHFEMAGSDCILVFSCIMLTLY